MCLLVLTLFPACGHTPASTDLESIFVLPAGVVVVALVVSLCVVVVGTFCCISVLWQLHLCDGCSYRIIHVFC